MDLQLKRVGKGYDDGYGYGYGRAGLGVGRRPCFPVQVVRKDRKDGTQRVAIRGKEEQGGRYGRGATRAPLVP